MIQQQAPTQPPAGEQTQQPQYERTSPLSQCTQLISSNPGLSVTVGFGVGFGAGVMLAMLLGGSRGFLSRQESMVERIGHRVADSMKDAFSSLKNPLRS